MFKSNQRRLSAFAILILCFQYAKSQNIPPIPCPDIFQYMSFDGNYIGMVTLKKLPLQTTIVDVEFTQREPITTNFNGRLSLSEDLRKTQANLESGKPLSYRVDFPNSRILPKLTGIKVNGAYVCTGQGLDPPNTSFKLQHSFFPAVPTTLSRPSTTKTQDNDDIHITLLPTTHNVIPSIPQNTKQNPPQFSLTNPFINNLFGNQSHTSVFEIPLQTVQPAPAQPVTPRINVAPKPSPSQDVRCGLEGLTPFVVGGNDFPRGKFPWLVAIYIRDSADLKFKCGGSLISSRTVITAAHCFPTTTFPSDRISVNLGRHNLFVSEEDSQQRDISSVTFHPDYNISAISDADIALLHMSIPVRFNQYIRPICLWAQSSDLSLIVNNNAYVAGWGSDNKGNSVSSIAKMVEAKIVSESECLRSSEIFRILTSARSICAGNRDGTGPCIGDSGGGLMMNVYGVWTLRGVLSVGKTVQRNCDLNEFVVYCDVAKHMTWIKRNMYT